MELGVSTKKKEGSPICMSSRNHGKNILDDNMRLPNGNVVICHKDWSKNSIFGNLIESNEFKRTHKMF